MGWQDWGWRRWRRCWRRPSRRKPDWWRVEWVPLIFNCLWNIIYPTPCLSYKRDLFHEFKKEAPGPFGITALKIVSYLQRVIDMKGWILTSSPTVILTQTISCWMIFSCIPSHPALCILCICMYFFPYCLLNLLTVDLKPLCVLICLSIFSSGEGSPGTKADVGGWEEAARGGGEEAAGWDCAQAETCGGRGQAERETVLPGQWTPQRWTPQWTDSRPVFYQADIKSSHFPVREKKGTVRKACINKSLININI